MLHSRFRPGIIRLASVLPVLAWVAVPNGLQAGNPVHEGGTPAPSPLPTIDGLAEEALADDAYNALLDLFESTVAELRKQGVAIPPPPAQEALEGQAAAIQQQGPEQVLAAAVAEGPGACLLFIETSCMIRVSTALEGLLKATLQNHLAQGGDPEAAANLEAQVVPHVIESAKFRLSELREEVENPGAA